MDYTSTTPTDRLRLLGEIYDVAQKYGIAEDMELK
jgi:hypothetical protein